MDMILEIPKGQLIKLLFKQIDSLFFLEKQEKKIIELTIDTVLTRCSRCFFDNPNKYYSKLIDGLKYTYFSPFQSAQYTIYLYYFSNTLSATATKLADKIYYLNKVMNGCDLYHQVELPDIFMLDHPVGSVMGRAKYGSNFSFGQNCTVGNNNNIYPIIGKSVRMCASSSIIGNCKISDFVILGAGCLVKDQDVPKNTLVFGSSPNLIFKRIKE